ncbi:SCO family protein [Crocinitomix algicola]|uniref:SCO family protein n=1 Tax=Crocinitomix algicola TaxID=1740263 RepID=UPI0008733CDB|nr:SCO family protein [Crocinitomix algicola]
MKKLLYVLTIGLLITACQDTASSNNNSRQPKSSGLPYFGFHEIAPGDTSYHTIPTYQLLAQDSSEFNNERVKGKIHVANFFFTSCPAICPAMIAQMKRLQENTNDIEELQFLSHTIDPKRDSIPKLNQYIKDKNLDTHNWYFLYGEREYVHDLGRNGYMLNAMEDEEAEGGFLHSEHFVLVDREGHIRGLYTGTVTEEVDQLEKDIRTLIATEYGE